jgi:uncharacterized protein YjbJ (UPF0337 family)
VFRCTRLTETAPALKYGNVSDVAQAVPNGFVLGRSTSRILINADSSLVKSSTKDKIRGRIDEAKGKVKEKTGEAAVNSDLRDRGAAEKAGGKIQRKIGDVIKVFGK